MISEDQKILFISNARVIAIIRQKDSLNTGFVEKKIVLTTRRCLTFESLGNQAKEIEYEVLVRRGPNKAPGQAEQQQPRKSKLSINNFPESWFNADERDARVVIDEEPTIMSFFSKLGIRNIVKNTVGMVLLKNQKKEKFQALMFPALKESFRFAKGLMCAKAWLQYEKYCEKNKMPLNFLWVRILQEIVTHENSLTLIDPDLFQTGSPEEIKAFTTLVSSIPLAHSFQLRYSIVNDESINYTIDFLKVLEDKIHSITLSKTGLTSENLLRILISNLRTKNLMKLNLDNNELTDRCFNGLQFLARENKKLSYISLAHNQITLSNFSNLLEFLKTTPIILNLNLTYNKITDNAVLNIEKYILFALNPPIEEMDVSFNEFSLKGAWRLYLGFLKNFRNHVYLNFIIYPIPFKKEIFSQIEVDFPKKESEINFNMHSALIEQFEQESMMKHTMHDILVPTETITIRFIRQLLPNVRLPKNKQQMGKTLQISNKIQNFIYTSQSVEGIYNMATEMKKFPFEVPPRTRNNFVFYLNKKLNEALLIRDHYSVKYIMKSMKELEIPYPGYFDRLERVQQRDEMLCQRFEKILEFRHNQATINKEIDELVKEGLRLYLEGQGIQLLYYLKYARDQHIQRFLAEKYNPQHQIYGKMAARNLSNDQMVSAKDFVIPYEIKIEKKINQNFYLHPWQTNYLVLSEMTPKAFTECLEFLENSEKRETFAKYFERIEERVEFIQNEFSLFTYKQFKVSYTDLKVNACRLLFLYKNIQQTHFYLQIPIYIKKRPITCERQILVNNPEQFMKKYHIVHYPNINFQAKKNNFYNYPHVITRYLSETFDIEVKKTLSMLNNILQTIEYHVHAKKTKEELIEKILYPIKDLIDLVRHSIYPEQIKEEIYLHLIGWRKGKQGRNQEVMELVPWLTMYLKPPIQIQKYLVAAMLDSKKDEISQFPMCLVSDVNKPTPEDILKFESQFVQRDWIPPDSILKEEMLNTGKLFIEIHLLDKRKIGFKIAQSMNISQLMSYIMGFHEFSCQDRQCFWLYKLDKETQQTTPLTGSDYVGQIMSMMNPDVQIFVCRRRIYSREIKYVYMLYGEVMIDSFYAEIKFDYMMRGLFDSDKNVFEITSLLFIIDNVENFDILVKKNPKGMKDKKIEDYILDEVNRLEMIFPAYIPRHIMARIMKDKETLFSQIKAKVNERMLKRQHLAIYEMKTQFIRYFEHFPEFCSTTYKMYDNNQIELKVFINCMYMYIESENQRQYIKLEKIISIIPKSKYILIAYHKNENIIGQIPLFTEESNILAVAMDLLTYCLMRLKVASNNLYEINKFQRLEEEILEIEKSLKKIYHKSLEEKLFKNRQQKNSIFAKIMKMSITLMGMKQLIYYTESKYIKSFLDRKLYANKSERKMAYSTQMDEQQARITENWNTNLFAALFPQYNEKYNRNDQNESYDHFELIANDEYAENGDYDVEFYKDDKDQGRKILSKNDITPVKPTEKKQQPQETSSIPQTSKVDPAEDYLARTSKKVPPPPIQTTQPKVQPKVEPQQNTIVKPSSVAQRKPSQTLNQPAVTSPPPSLTQPGTTNPTKSQNPPPTETKPSEPPEEEEAVFKKPGGRNVPPRRRQR